MRKVILSRLSVVSFCILLLACKCAAKPQKSSEGFTKQKILAEFTIARGGDPILLPVKFQGKEHLFVLDTGCSYTVFDTSLRPELGNPIRTGGTILTLGATIPGQLFDAPKASLGHLNLQDCGQVTCADLKMLSAVEGQRISGLIGMNFLKKYVVQIDSDKGKLLFLKPRAGKNPQWGQTLEIEYHPVGLPFISGIILNDIKVDFVIDTGANVTAALHYLIFKKIISEKKIRTSETLFATAGGTIRMREARIGSFSIGSFRYKDLIFGDGNSSYLGLAFFSRHLVTFDFPNNKLYLKKGKNFKKVDQTDMSGLHLLRISGQTTVHSVDQGSPAQKAGIKANDIILKANNKDAKAYGMWELRQLLMSADKKKITMTIKSGDDVKELSFLLEKKI